MPVAVWVFARRDSGFPQAGDAAGVVAQCKWVRRSMKFTFAILLIFLGLVLPGLAEDAAPREDGALRRRPVLIINSYHAGYQWTEEQIAGIRRKLDETHQGIEYYVEYLDTKRLLPGYRLYSRAADFIKNKYQGIEFAAVFVTDDNALDFMIDYYGDLFSGVPVIFCGINRDTSQLLAKHPQFAGVEERKDIRGTLDLALKLVPAAHHVILLGDGTATSRVNREQVETALKDYPQLNLISIDGSMVAFGEILALLGKISPDSFCLFLGFWRDRSGLTIPPDVALRKFSEACSLPIFVNSDSYLGQGALGGIVASARAHGEAAGRLAAEILSGRRPESSSAGDPGLNVALFDARAMKRFGIRESDLPADAQFINKPPPSIFVRHKLEVAVLAVAGLAVLALFLAVSKGWLQKTGVAKALAESENDLATILEAIGDGVIAADAHGRIGRINAAAVKLTGWGEAEALGKPVEEIYRVVDSQTRKRASDRFAKIMDGDPVGTQPGNRLLIGCDGAESLVSESGSAIRDRKGARKGAVLVFRDVTEMNKLQDDLRHAQKMEAIGKLAGGVAHDFNNLLTGIIGNAELIRISLDGETDLLECAEQIIKSSSRAADLAGQVLTFSRKGRPNMKAVDINSVLDEVIALLAHSIDRRIEVVKRLDAYRHWVHGDATQLQNVFLNLSINARDAMPEGGTLSFRTHDVVVEPDSPRTKSGEVEPGKYIEIQVSDTGMGIEQKLRERIFEPFFTTKDEGKGTGLGLAMVYGTVQTHRGSVELHSRPGHGTTFTVLLPVCAAPDSAEVPKAAGERSRAKGKGHILVVDDEEAIRVLLGKMLKQLGYQVSLSADGMEAVEFYARHGAEVDLVILDLMMPRMDGEKAFARIRAINPAAKIMIVSGFTKSKVVDDLLAKGALGFLAKPFHMSEISDEMLKHLG